MYWTPTLLAGLGSLASTRAAIGDVLAGAPISNISVSADNLAQCSDATVSWTGTVPPVSLMVGTGGYYAGLQPVHTYDNLDGSSTTVYIDQKEGTTMIFQITDANGQVGYVQNLKVGGGDASCLGGQGEGGSSRSAAASSSSAAGGAAPSVVESSSAWSEEPAPSSSSSAAGSGSSSSSNAPAPSSASSTSTSSGSSNSAAAAPASASASASTSSQSAAAADSASASATPATVDASAANAPNAAQGLVIPGLSALGLVVGAAALL